MLKRNLVANYIGQIWSALMSIAFIPLYIKYLGIESYGLIGLFGMLLTWLGLLDLGMTPTLSREMARYTGGVHTAGSIRNLLRSIECLALLIALIIGLGVWLSSDWLASDWLRTDKLSPKLVAESFSIMGIVSALRFIENVYRSAIIGLQKHIVNNFISIIMSTLRGLGSIGVLIWISKSIRVFFLWQGIISLITLFILGIATYLYLPKTTMRTRFSFESLKGVGSFAGGIIGISLLSLLLTQIDKILLSRLLNLTDYGYYTLASISAGASFLIIGPISQVWAPKLSELHAVNDKLKLTEKYHQGAQLISVFMGSLSIMFLFFGESILFIWTRNAELASKTSIVFRILSVGNLLNGFNTMPYLLQLAYGWTSLVTKINLFAAFLIIPILIIVTPKFGAIGAALAWLFLNAGYVFIGVHFMFRKILTDQKWIWFRDDLLLPILSAGITAFVLSNVMPKNLTLIHLVIYLFISGTFVFMASSFSSYYMRNSIFFLFQYVKKKI